MLKLAAEKRAMKKTDGNIPVVVYGPKTPSTSLFVKEADFKKLWQEAGESTIISLETPDGNIDTLIHDIQFHPVKGNPIHADFYALDISKPIEVDIPLVFEGIPPAVKNLGGILVKVLHEIKIEVLPKELPHSLVADVSLLAELDSNLTAKDIKLPPSAILKTNPEETVAIIDVPKEEEEEAPTTIDLDSIEVEKKGKTEEAEGEPVVEEGAEKKKEKKE